MQKFSRYTEKQHTRSREELMIPILPKEIKISSDTKSHGIWDTLNSNQNGGENVAEVLISFAEDWTEEKHTIDYFN